MEDGGKRVTGIIKIQTKRKFVLLRKQIPFTQDQKIQPQIIRMQL